MEYHLQDFQHSRYNSAVSCTATVLRSIREQHSGADGCAAHRETLLFLLSAQGEPGATAPIQLPAVAQSAPSWPWEQPWGPAALCLDGARELRGSASRQPPGRKPGGFLLNQAPSRFLQKGFLNWELNLMSGSLPSTGLRGEERRCIFGARVCKQAACSH